MDIINRYLRFAPDRSQRSGAVRWLLGASLLVIPLSAGGCITTTSEDCGGSTSAGSAELAYDEFLSKLPDAVCDYYVRCGIISSAERAGCPVNLYDDIAREISCDGAADVYTDWKLELDACLKGGGACGTTDDLDQFCPELFELGDYCEGQR